METFIPAEADSLAVAQLSAANVSQGSGMQWAPGVAQMTFLMALIVAAMTLPYVVMMTVDMTTTTHVGSWLGGLAIAILLALAYPAHRSYKRAKAALAAEPALRGGWLVRNLWWVVMLGLFGVPLLVGLGRSFVVGLRAF